MSEGFIKWTVHIHVKKCEVVAKTGKKMQFFEAPVAFFIVPDWGDKVDSGIGMSYRHARLHIPLFGYQLKVAGERV
jgi:hypothetical protein